MRAKWVSRDHNGLWSYWTKKPCWFIESGFWAGDIGTIADPCSPSLRPSVKRGDCKKVLAPRELCRSCQKLVPLTNAGLLRTHNRHYANAIGNWTYASCEGSGLKPSDTRTYLEQLTKKLDQPT